MRLSPKMGLIGGSLGLLLAALALLFASVGPVNANPAQPFQYNLVYSADSLYAYQVCGGALTEDSWRTWEGYGSLSGTFRTTVTYCSDPGGEGLSVRLTNIRKAHDLSITYPDGTTVHGDWLCVITPQPFVDAIAPGIYTITLTADYRNVALDVESGMASAQWREGHCP